MYKRVAAHPDWLGVANVIDIFSLSSCISEDFADYINFWKHNGYWLFDSPEIMQSIAAEQSISLATTRLFYYEAFEEEYDDDKNSWIPFLPEPSFKTEIQAPLSKTLEGFDVACFTGHTSPECSPLSCNADAATIPTNAHCLFGTFEEAKNAIEQGLFKNSEPGPYRIISVYTIADPDPPI